MTGNLDCCSGSTRPGPLLAAGGPAKTAPYGPAGCSASCARAKRGKACRSNLWVMPEDLYHANLKSITGTELHQSILDFTHVDRPKNERPREGYLLDFKQEIGDKFIRVIAALANTFGGLVILGISDDDRDGRPDSLLGIAYSGELKTRVANLIGSNLVPCPMFDIAECALPNDPGKKLCVVRVRETQEVCLITTKGEKNPVYVRVEDKSEPADSSALRALLERKRQLQNVVEDLQIRLNTLRERLVFSSRDTFGGIVHSKTFFRLIFCPTAHPLLPLDIVIENQFRDLVLNPPLLSLINNGDAKHEFQRSRDWFEIRFLDQSLGYERRWHLTNHADVGFITEMNWPSPGLQGLWSLYDLAADLITIAKVVKEFWQLTGYYGSFRLEAELQVQDLRLKVEKDGFHPLYYTRLSPVVSLPLQSEILAIVGNPRSTGNASADFSYQDLNLSLSDIVADVLNQLLRSLGHGPTIEKLKVAVQSITS
jgi:hypothetical protein